jgi:hypothetical protein
MLMSASSSSDIHNKLLIDLIDKKADIDFKFIPYVFDRPTNYFILKFQNKELLCLTKKS